MSTHKIHFSTLSINKLSFRSAIFSMFVLALFGLTLTVGCKNENSVVTPDGPAAQSPTADFTSNLNSGNAVLTVRFNDRSTGNPTSWVWDFGDGSTSQEQHPVHAYSSPGYFTVSLKVGNDGGSDTETKSSYIAVSQAYVQVRHASAYSGSVSVEVNGSRYEIQKNQTTQIPVTGGTSLSVYECLWIGYWFCRWDNGYHVLPGRSYKVVDVTATRWDLSIASDN